MKNTTDEYKRCYRNFKRTAIYVSVDEITKQITINMNEQGRLLCVTFEMKDNKPSISIHTCGEDWEKDYPESEDKKYNYRRKMLSKKDFEYAIKAQEVWLQLINRGYIYEGIKGLVDHYFPLEKIKLVDGVNGVSLNIKEEILSSIDFDKVEGICICFE